MQEIHGQTCSFQSEKLLKRTADYYLEYASNTDFSENKETPDILFTINFFLFHLMKLINVVFRFNNLPCYEIKFHIYFISIYPFNT